MAESWSSLTFKLGKYQVTEKCCAITDSSKWKLEIKRRNHPGVFRSFVIIEDTIRKVSVTLTGRHKEIYDHGIRHAGGFPGMIEFLERYDEIMQTSTQLQ